LVKDKINVAIDGPVASGKTTIGKKLAQQLNYQFLDSGLLFRHFAQFCQKNNPSELTDEQVIKLKKARGILSASAIGNLASQLSPLPELRKIILDFQRALTQEKT
ncbi:11314_t:CDS:2, partial [Racocetra persica]